MSQELDAINELKSSLEKRDSELNKQSEAALKAAQNAGELSEATKASVDKLLSEQNADRIALNALESRLGEAEKLYANLPSQGQKAQAQVASQIVANYEKMGDFAKRIQANEPTRLSIPMPRSALTSPDLKPGVIEEHRLPGILPMLKQRLVVRDLITPGRTANPTVTWVQQTGFTNNAAVVPENTLKPTSEIEFDVKNTTVATIAHLFKASKQILDDMPQLSSTIDGELRYGLKYAEELELLFGDGTGAHLLGIMPQASAFKAPTGANKATTQIDLMRLAMLQAQLARLPATGHVMHFTDWANIELQKDTLGRYIIGNPQGTTAPSLWNLPIVETEIPQFIGKFLTGAFAGAAQIFDREDANVVISSENNDDFEKNMITIRCEERLALAVYRPEAFITGDLAIAP
jgi:HK97 family phage major capsid protein